MNRTFCNSLNACLIGPSALQTRRGALSWRMPSRLAHTAPRIAALGILLIAVALSRLLHPRVLPRLPWEALGQPVPGTDGSVLLLDGFLSEAEVQHILAAGRQALGLAAASPAQQARMYASTELHARDDPVLAALDERVANLSGIPVHTSEGTFRVAVSRPWLGAAAATDVKVHSPPPPGKAARLPARLAVQPHHPVQAPHGTHVHQVQNLHHDTAAGRPGRVATLLMYLSDSESSDLSGGGTFRVSLACTVRTTVHATLAPRQVETLCFRAPNEPHLSIPTLEQAEAARPWPM